MYKYKMLNELGDIPVCIEEEGILGTPLPYRRNTTIPSRVR